MIALALAALMVLTPVQPSSSGAKPVPRPAPCDHIPWENGPNAVRRLIRCAARVWDVPGGAAKATDVAMCESSLRPDTRGGAGDWYVGLYQHDLRRWDDRVATFRWVYDLDPDWRNAHTAVVITFRMVKAVGWSPWECA